MLPLFAGAADLDDLPPEWLPAFLIGLGICILVWLVAAIPVLLTLSKALCQCSPRKRVMEPAQVWLNLIPVFNLVWQFVTVVRVAESLRREYRRRRLRKRDDFGQTIGMVACTSSLLMFCFAPVYLICGTIYWRQIAGYGRRLAREAEYADCEETPGSGSIAPRYNQDHGPRLE